MANLKNQRSRKGVLILFIALPIIAMALFAILWFIDFGGEDISLLDLWQSKGVADTLTGLSEVTVAVLGIALTVVAIIVELAAHRYTPRITDLFIRDRTNQLAMSFFVFTSLLVLWVNMSLYGPHPPGAMMIGAGVAMTLSLLTLLPYFGYILEFLTPTRVIAHIEDKSVDAIKKVAERGQRSIDSARQELIDGVEQLGDMALNSVDKKDKAIAIASLNALANLAEASLVHKKKLPEPWFDAEPLAAGDQDFVALHKAMLRTLPTRKTWVEMKIFRQYQSIFADATTNRMPDIGHLVAIHTRRIAGLAGATSDIHVVRMAMRFLNTYLRAAINAKDVRSAYNLLNEYRMLAEGLLVRRFEPLLMEVAGYLKFYGQLAFNQNLPFILETAAYDLCTLLERAHRIDVDCHDDLLDLFLDVDREPEGGPIQETSLRGVRKAQVKLATHYLVHEDIAHARYIFEDMQEERTERLSSIRDELESIVEPEYWEVSDRGANFDYLPPDRRKTLEDFFSWFVAEETEPTQRSEFGERRRRRRTERTRTPTKMN